MGQRKESGQSWGREGEAADWLQGERLRQSAAAISGFVPAAGLLPRSTVTGDRLLSFIPSLSYRILRVSLKASKHRVLCLHFCCKAG